jgi:HlyD family type I secretion membrane fusion protein
MPSRRALAQRQSTQAIVDFQSETAEVIGRTQTLATSAVVWVLSVMVVTALFLASVVRLDRVVTSPGELVAVNGTFVVQPLDTSLVKKIRVHEGDVVAKGQVLATLDPTFTTADVSDLQQKIGSLRAEIARLSAERDDKTYIPEVDDSYGALQAQIWERRHSEYASQLKDYDQRIGSSQEQVNKASKDADLLRSRLKIQQDIEQMRTTLEQHETGSRLNALMATDNRLEVARNLVATENQISSSSHDLESLRAQRQVYIDHWRNDIVQNIVTQQNALDSTLEDLSKAQKRSDLIELQAPEDAVVLKISRSVSEGAVAQAAEQLFTLVPLNAPMEAEVQINARDLGFIQPGDHVELKLDAYRYLEHGTVKGTVKTVSSDSFTEDLKDSRATAPFYRARIQLTDVKLRNVPKTFRLIPGMPLQADIVVGTRTIMSYLVGGALQNLDEGMREP